MAGGIQGQGQGLQRHLRMHRFDPICSHLRISSNLLWHRLGTSLLHNFRNRHLLTLLLILSWYT